LSKTIESSSDFWSSDECPPEPPFADDEEDDNL